MSVEHDCINPHLHGGCQVLFVLCCHLTAVTQGYHYPHFADEEAVALGRGTATVELGSLCNSLASEPLL